MFAIDSLHLIFTLFSVFLIIIVNEKSSNDKLKFIFNFLFISESITLSFFFYKFPLYFSLVILVLSGYYFEKANSNFAQYKNNHKKIFTGDSVTVLKYTGYVILISMLLYEFYTDIKFTSLNLLVTLFSLFCIFYNTVPSKFSNENDMVLIFLGLISLLILLPGLLNEIPQLWSSTLFQQEFLVNFFLGRPLYHFLSLLGFNVISSADMIYYEDLESGLFQGVVIAKSCAGLNSIVVFVSALTSYLLVEYRKLDKRFFAYIFFGILISYFANLFRMALVIISGHYFGLSVLLQVHEYAGWLIFTAWVFIFWYVMDYINLNYER